MNPTEEKILAAAEAIFMKHGYDGSRMQAIADLAEINKAMLHYYFRSKDKLFERIFETKFHGFFPTVENLINHENNFTDKACVFAEQYTRFLIKNPYLPQFILSTIQKNPEFAKKLPHHIPQMLMMSYLEDCQNGLCKAMNPAQLFMSIFGICVAPFMGKPLFINLLGASEDDFNELMEMRAEEIKDQIRAILKP